MGGEDKSGTYTPRKDEANAEQYSDQTNLSGASPRAILQQEAAAQRAVAESPKWLLARRTNPRNEDSRAGLEALGFTIVGEADDLFYEVTPPKGWTKTTDGYWTYVVDESGVERVSQFFKGAFYDKDAFVNIKAN